MWRVDPGVASMVISASLTCASTLVPSVLSCTHFASSFEARAGDLDLRPCGSSVVEWERVHPKTPLPFETSQDDLGMRRVR